MEVKIGKKYRHFKGNMYEVLHIAYDSESSDDNLRKLVVYKALYGDNKYNKNAKVGEQIALFAKELELIHPTTKEVMKFILDVKDKYPWNIFKENKQ